MTLCLWMLLTLMEMFLQNYWTSIDGAPSVTSVSFITEVYAVHRVAKSWADWATSLSLFTFMNWRRKWQPTPVFLPGGSQGQRGLVGCRLWGRTELNTSDLAAAAAAAITSSISSSNRWKLEIYIGKGFVKSIQPDSDRAYWESGSPSGRSRLPLC